MLPLWKLWFIFLIPALSQLQTDARPTTRNTFISVPLTKVYLRDTTDEHPTIVHQQNINNALKRYARSTGRAEPSQEDLFKNIINRASTVPWNELQKRYYKEGYKKILDYLNLNLAPPGGVNSAEDIVQPSSQHNNGARPHVYTQTNTHSPAPGSVALAIQAQDVGYMIPISIGTPSRTFNVLVDSGSADLWVGAEDCHSESGGSCGNHVFLGPRSSSSFKQLNQTWTIGYGTGSVDGYLVQDSVTIAGFQLPHLKFGTAYRESSDFTGQDIPFDGLFGLAKSQYLSRQGVMTSLEAMAEAKLISQPIVSYKIPRFADHKNDGEVTFGGMDPAKYDASTLVTVSNKNRLGFWEVALDAIHVNGADLGWRNRTLILDTGTTLIIAPSQDVAALHAKIPGAKKDGDIWTVPCTLSSPMSFTIGGREFSIDPRDIAFTPVDQAKPNGACLSGISEGNPGLVKTEWLAGDVFLKNVYFSTNMGTDRISFAKSV
ncbi:hypothetical protein AX15_005848 [Amanita polypyramis BW_CC]|nr:hypothetical protein AX15_005848 [Amanita polypyramis BW_CC]